jgi:regulator of replication initiation timing
MRLSIEEVRDLKEALVCDKNRNLLTYTCCLELIDAIEALQQDIEQLRAQVARMREVLEFICNEADFETLQEEIRIRDVIRKVLSCPQTDYHNPADIEKVKQQQSVEAYKYPWKYTKEERPCGTYGKCYDCGMPYSEFPDMVLPNELWELINPSQYKGAGLLCPTCMANRLDFIGKWYKTGLYMLKSCNFPYHNPADVEALRKAREALCDALDEVTYSREWHVKEAIAEIDKALGGNADV